MTGGLLLAGGRGNRIGGRKALLKIGNRSLISYVIETALAFTNEILVVVGKEEDIEDLRDILPSQVRIVSDILPGRGPLVGIYSGFRHLRSEYSAVLPCDSPFINVGVMRHLIERSEGLDAAVPIWPNGYIEPLHSVYRVKAALKSAEEAIEGGRLRVHSMVEGLERVVYISVDELKKFDPGLLTFFNINSPSDLKTAEKYLRK